MVDYTSFRDAVDNDFQDFLDKTHDPNRDEEEGNK